MWTNPMSRVVSDTTRDICDHGGVIVVVGEALVDLVIDPDGQVTAALGGAPFNTARACGRLGADVAFLGTISVDRFGTLLAARLAADHVHTDHVVRLERPTTLAAAELDAGGTASYRFYIQGTSAPAFSTVPAGLEPDVLFTGGLGLVLEPMAETVEHLVHDVDDGCLVVVDVNCRPLVIPDRRSYLARVERVLAGAHLVKVSDEDLAYLVPTLDPLAAARSLLDRGPRTVLLTAGASGVHVLTRDGEATVPVEPVAVVDTIGAGDSFGGGFLAWWTETGRAVAEIGSLDHVVPAVRAANVVAGVVCTRRGADPPWRDELPAGWSG
jgi:fructokinase